MMTPEQAIESVRMRVGEVPMVLCSVTVAEIGHGIYRADTAETRSRRRKFLDELKATVPVYPVTDSIAEIVARIGGEQAAKGINLALADLMIAACGLEFGYAVATSKLRDFSRVHGLEVIQL
jgi:predicted nucleic acid-binding protein